MARILVAFDRSPGARAALARVVTLFPNAQVCMAEAVSAPDGTSTDLTGPPPWDELLATTERDLLDVARQAGVTGEVTSRVSVGDAAEMLLATAEEWKPDVLAIGTHHRGPVTRLFLGSVAEKVVRQAKVPVLVVGVVA